MRNTPLKWLLLAGLFWLVSSVLEFHSKVEIYSTGGRVDFTVAGTTLTAPVAIDSVEAVSIHVVDGIEPPGGSFIKIKTASEKLIEEQLPRRFVLPAGTRAPVGDWELDDGAAATEVYRRKIDSSGEILINTELTGRFLHHATITLHGQPTISFQFRRGMINNDLFIRDNDGEVVAVTTIDPRPLHDLGSAMTILLRSGTAAALLIFLCGITCRPREISQSQVISSPNMSRVSIVSIVAVLAFFVVLRSMWIAGDVLDEIPHQPDSVVYNLQARWMLDGALSAEIPPSGESGRMPYTYFTDGRWVSHYPAGWPLVLVTGLALGKVWIVAPMLGGLYIILLFALARQLYGDRIGVIVIVLASVSPMLALMFACQLSHALSSTLIVAFFLVFTVAHRTSKMWFWALAGVVLGCSFGVRPLTAVALALPCVWLMVMTLIRAPQEQRRNLSAFIVMGIGGLVATIPTLVNNALITGNALDFPYSLAKGSMYGIENLAFGIRNMDTMLASTVPAIFGWGWGFVSGWLFLALPLAFAMVPLLKARDRKVDFVVLVLFLGVVVAHIPTRAHGLHGFGPRYYFDVFFCLYLLTARGFVELTRGGGKSGRSRVRAFVLPVFLFIVLNLSTLVRLPERFELYRGYNQVNGCLREQLHAGESALNLVFFADDDWRNWAEATPVLNRGGDESIFSNLPKDPALLIDLFPAHTVWLWDGETLKAWGSGDRYTGSTD